MNKTKIFFLATGDVMRASSRLRVWKIVDLMRGQGFVVSVDHFNMSSALYNKLGEIGIFANFTRKLVLLPKWLFQSFCANVIILQEVVCFPIFINILRRMGKIVIFDFSDPLDAPTESRFIVKRLFSQYKARNFRSCCLEADHVIVENRLYREKEFIDQSRCTVFPGPVDCDFFSPMILEKKDEFVIGWTGSPGTLHILEPLIPVIDELAGEFPLRLHLVGVNQLRLEVKNLKIEFHSWTQASEPTLVSAFDLGLFRLPESVDGLYRGGGKLFIYLALGVPFVATDVGIGAQIMTSAGVGFPVRNESDWKAVLRHAILNNTSRRNFREAGRVFAEKHLSHLNYASLLKEIITGLNGNVL